MGVGQVAAAQSTVTTSSNADATGNAGQIVTSRWVDVTFSGGSSARGAAYGWVSRAFFNGANPNNPNPNYVTAGFFNTVLTNDGGTSASPRGGYFGSAFRPLSDLTSRT